MEQRDAVEQRIRQLETRARRQARAMGMLLIALALAAGLSLVPPVLAASGACGATNGPDAFGLLCFASGQPAVANDVNSNFAHLAEWVNDKVGAKGSVAEFGNHFEVGTRDTDNARLATTGNLQIFVDTDDSTTDDYAVRITANRDSYIDPGIRKEIFKLYEGGALDIMGNFNAPSVSVAGTDLDAVIDTRISTYLGNNLNGLIKSYLEQNCRIRIGLRDSCSSTSDCSSQTPSVSVAIGVNDANTSLRSETTGARANMGGNWAAIETDIIDSPGTDELLFVAFTCT